MSDLLIKMPIPYEPKLKSRFVLRFPSDLGIQEWTVQSTGRPQMSVSETEIPFMNTKFYVAGTYSWSDLTVTFKDAIGPSTMQALMEWMRLVAESASGRMGYAAGYKRDIELELLDPNGVVIEKWIVVGAWPKEIRGGDLTMNDGGLLEATVTLRPDYCILAY